MPRTGFRIMLALAAITSAASATAAQAAPACAWVEGHEKIGIACEGSQEMWYATLSCEGAPLHLYLIGEECGAATCGVSLRVDGRTTPLGQGRYSDDGWGGITVPLAGRATVLDRLKEAKTLSFVVGNKPPQTVPTAGLRQAVGTLKQLCPQ